MDLENPDPLPPPGDCLESGENMGALLSPGGKACLGWLLQPGLLLPEMGEGAAHRAGLGGHTPAPPKSHRILCLLYWCCWLGERELGPGLGGSELALGARSA